jgi:hypothetical protein
MAGTKEEFVRSGVRAMTRRAKISGEVNPDERELLNKFIGSVLDRYSVGDVNRGEAIDEIVRMITAVRGANWRPLIEARISEVA